MVGLISAMDEPIAHFKIALEKHVVKKNNRPVYRRPNGLPFIGKSKELQIAENFLHIHLLSQKAKQITPLIKPIDYPIHVKFLFHFPKEVYYTKKGPISKNLPDLSNLIELPQDALQDANIIDDDHYIHSLDFSRRICSDKYLLEIFIYKYNND